MKLRGSTLKGILILVVIVIALVILNKPHTTSTQSRGADLSVGASAPIFSLETLTGETVSLSDFKGKKVIVNFWASWCPPCRVEMPEFEHHAKNDDTLVVLAVNLQENVQTIQQFVTEHTLTFPILLDPDAEVKQLYRVRTQPVTYFIDESGIIFDKKMGPLTAEELSARLSGEPSIGVSAPVDTSEIKTLEDGTKYIVHPSELMSGGPPKDGIPSIDEPEFISVDEADEIVADDELVLGLQYKGVKRAYPFHIMVWHELVNDWVAGEPLLISYCPLCGTGIAFLRELDSEAVEFGVSGKLHDSDMVMYDRKTDTYWEQLSGRAIIGERTGERLRMVPLDTVTWKQWKTAHPDSQVLSRSTGHIRRYGTDPYGDYYTSSQLYFPVENNNDVLHPKTVIWGVEIDGVTKAYPQETLEDAGTVEDTLGNTTLSLSINEYGEVTVLADNSEIAATRAFWFAWYTFNPSTLLYEN